VVLQAIEAQAPGHFDRTLDALGRPEPPTSPPTDLLEPVRNAVIGIGVDEVTDGALRRLAESMGGPPPAMQSGAHD
jgi:hypothetical protein